MPIKLTAQQLRSLAQALDLLAEVEAETGVRLSPNQPLELGVGDAWISCGRDEQDRLIVHDRIGD